MTKWPKCNTIYLFLKNEIMSATIVTIVKSKLIHTEQGLGIEWRDSFIPLKVPEGLTAKDFDVETEYELEFFYSIQIPMFPDKVDEEKNWIELTDNDLEKLLLQDKFIEYGGDIFDVQSWVRPIKQ